ncbi:MAG TPA: glycosyltransferase family 2 protein [Enterococcus sp.]|nr:glycosyltransferase family 2 protein [Enterococcus sp.]
MSNKVTIIIPCYNSSKNINKLLESLNLYENKNIHCLLIDDKSDENEFNDLSKAISKYPKSQISLIKNESDKKGAGVCRNIGLKFTNDEWVLFADSDDHFLKKFEVSLAKYTNSDADMIYFPPISSDEFGEIGSRHYTYLEYFNDFYMSNNYSSLKYKLPVVWSRLYRLSFIRRNNISFDETIVSNDRMFALKSGFYCDNYIVSDSTIYSWDYNKNSLTVKMTKEKYIVNLNVYVSVNKFLKRNLDKFEYIQVSESIFKFIAMSLFRYKFGFFFTSKIFLFLVMEKMPLIRISDLFRIKNFFRNNDIYK